MPDTQVRPGEPTQHLRWVGYSIKRYEPDIVVHLGDHWDMNSLSFWNSKKEQEGARVSKDIEAGNNALQLLEDSMEGYKPKRKILLRGNHEYRLQKFLDSDPKLEGSIGFDQFNDKELGWEVVDYFHGSPKAIELEGIQFAHYFANPMTGKPIGGTINNRLAKIGSSFVQGHQQGLLQGNVQYATGVTRHGIVSGSCYLHDESYKGMANTHWRGIVVLNEVRNGTFCEMPLTLDYLCREYEGVSLKRYMNKNFKRARERFTLAN